MGYIRNECLIISGTTDAIKVAHEECKRILENIDSEKPIHLKVSVLLSGIIPGMVNHCATFMIGVDGSKEGWAESDVAEKARERIITWLINSDEYYEWALVLLGGDDRLYEVLDHTGKKED